MIDRQEYDAVLLAVGSTVARDMQTAAWRNPQEKQNCLSFVSAKLVMISFFVMLVITGFLFLTACTTAVSQLWNQVHG